MWEMFAAELTNCAVVRKENGILLGCFCWGKNKTKTTGSKKARNVNNYFLLYLTINLPLKIFIREKSLKLFKISLVYEN
jgi:hypothetical protein